MNNEELTEQIINTAKSNSGVFTVSPRYRDDAKRRVCRYLKKKGIFKQTKYGVTEEYQLLSQE